jgi:hypothetical protein
LAVDLCRAGLVAKYSEWVAEQTTRLGLIDTFGTVRFDQKLALKDW